MRRAVESRVPESGSLSLLAQASPEPHPRGLDLGPPAHAGTSITDLGKPMWRAGQRPHPQVYSVLCALPALGTTWGGWPRGNGRAQLGLWCEGSPGPGQGELGQVPFRSTLPGLQGSPQNGPRPALDWHCPSWVCQRDRSRIVRNVQCVYTSRRASVSVKVYRLMKKSVRVRRCLWFLGGELDIHK